jgi:hypothetical protein
MVVLGDSLMWGQGLREENKFTTLVGNWIEASLPATRVTMYRYAHSGAVIPANEERDAGAPTPGEVPNPYPSITAQFWTATASIAASTPVDLVLMNGGANDVSIADILGTDASVNEKLERITAITRENCREPMARLLPYVLQKFPLAKVVLTSYYPIVSTESDLTTLTTYLAMHGIADGATPALRSRLSEQSQRFHEEYVNGVRTVALQAQPVEVAVSGAAASGAAPRGGVSRGAARRGTAAGVTRVQSITATSRRTAFAVIPFGPENSYGAGRSWLWRGGQEDQTATTRREQCHLVGQETPACFLASMGYPNIEGAEQYALAIQQQVEAFLPEWRQTFA